MFAKRRKGNVASSKSNGLGRVYVLELTLDNNEVIHKIGMCHAPRSADRMMEILRSWFMQYRYVPHTRCRLDYETGVPLLLEKHLHTLLKEWKWVPDKKVDGGQEMFRDIDVEEVISYVKEFDYHLLLENITQISTEDYEYIRSKVATTAIDLDEDIQF